MPTPAEKIPPSNRRVIALVLPALLVELAEVYTQKLSFRPGEGKAVQRRRFPVAVVLGEPSRRVSGGAEEIAATDVLSAVNETARRLGVREGQTVAEARAIASRLSVRIVERSLLDEGLARVAEIAFGFGSVVAFSAPDTVWVDVTGVSHLFGGEAGLASELAGRVREAGHRVRVAVSEGPLLAQAFARFGVLGPEGFLVVPSLSTRQALARLPVRALNLPMELESWFIRLGVLTIADLNALPGSALGARLAEHARRVFELIEGHDTTPLVRYDPPRILIEETSWEEPIDGREPLLFVLRGLVARISGRLRGRGEAAQALTLRILADPVVARFRGAPAQTTLEFSLPKPLHREEELGRIVSSRLERVALNAPSIGLRLEVPKLMEATPRQLELGSLLMGAKADALDELPIILAELAADIGQDRIGVLKTLDSHRPELTSQLVPALQTSVQKPRLSKTRPPLSLATVVPAGAPPLLGQLTRLLAEPILFDAPLRAGAGVMVEQRFCTIESVRFEHRVEAVEWWSRAVHRDYVSVVLRDGHGVFEALVYVDRETGRRYLQGILD